MLSVILVLAIGVCMMATVQALALFKLHRALQTTIPKLQDDLRGIESQLVGIGVEIDDVHREINSMNQEFTLIGSSIQDIAHK